MKMIFNKKILFAIICVFILSINTNAQSFKASVDRNLVGQNERFSVYFTFSGGDVNKLTGLKTPSFSGLKVISGPNQATNMQIIQGKVSGSIEYSYVIVGTKIGDFNISPATVNYGGKTYKTAPLKVKVVKANTNSNGKQVGGFSNEDLAKSVFIIAQVNKRSAYKGEQITVSYKLYTKSNISTPQLTKLPSYNGFWAVDLEMPKNIRFQIEMYKGERFRVAEIKKVALFATKAGKLNVTPFELTIPVIIKKKRNSRDVFEDFFNDSFFGRSETIEYLAKSNSLNLNIKELPTTGRPSSFNGAVGDFKFQNSIDKKNVKQNEAISLNFDISGTGNIELIEVPELNLPAGFEKYEPKQSKNINKKNIVSGKKSIEYLVVPRIPGEKTIPSLEFSYFNPVKKRYYTHKTPVYKINVEQGENTYASTPNGFSKENVKLLNEDIRFIKTASTSLIKHSSFSVFQVWYLAMYALPLIMVIGLVLYKDRKDKVEGNVKLLKFKKAEKAARQRLKSVKKFMDSSDSNSFYNELSQSLHGYLQDKLSIQQSEFTLEFALKTLEKNNVSENLLSETKSISEKCEFARFAPDSKGFEAEKELYNRTIKLIVDLENSIGSSKK